MLFVLFLAAAAGRWAESLSLEIPLKGSLQFKSPCKRQPCHSLKIGCGDGYLPSPAPKGIPCVFKAFVENMNTRDECLSPRVRLECNPEIPVAPGEEHWFLDTSLDEVYWPCSHSRAIPSFPSQLEWKIGLAWANTRGSLNSPS